ncbi:hypothetical protein ACFE04_020155 [Oxalis oulophora]
MKKDDKFEDETFYVVLDKGGLDALMEPSLGPILGNQYLLEVKKVLKSGVKFVSLTLVESHVVGDLGQTFDSNRTLTHYEMSPEKGQAILFVGDLSYADNYLNHDNNRWDSWERFAERSAAYQPWIWTAGNHELDFEPSIVKQCLLSLSKSGTVLLIKHQAVHLHCGKYTPQYQWLEAELPKVNRTETPWLIVLLHSP